MSVFGKYLKFLLFEDKIGNDIKSQTTIYNRWIKHNKTVYSVAEPIDCKTLQVKYKRPIRYTETQYKRLVTVYDRTLGVMPFKAVQGNKMLLGYGLDGLITIPIDCEWNNLTIGGTSGSGKSSLAKSIILNLILNGIEVYIMDCKNSFDYDLFKHNTKLYKGVNEFPSFLHEVSIELEKRLKHKQNKPLIVVIDEFYSIKTLKDGKKLFDVLAINLSICRAANVHHILLTQRSSSDIIPTSIMINVSTRIALQQATPQESHNLIFCHDAFYLNQKGHSYLCENGRLTEMKSFYLSDHEIENLLPPPPRQIDKIPTGEHDSIKNEVKYVKSYVVGGMNDGVNT